MIRSLLVRGRPVPKGSKRALGPGRMIESSAKGLNVWMKELRAELHTEMRGKEIMVKPAPVSVSLAFYLTPPKRTVRSEPTVPPDLDKLTRAVLDAMQGIVFEDDSQVVRIDAGKSYSFLNPGGVFISVWHFGRRSK